MKPTERQYRFNLRQWMLKLPIKTRSIAMEKVTKKSGQSKDTIRRITYMSIENTCYVRPETKVAICEVFGKTLNDLENQQQ